MRMNFLLPTIVFCFLLQGCKESIPETVVDQSCKDGVEDAKKELSEGKYSAYIPGMSPKLARYAEEMFEVYYGKKVAVRNTDLIMCGTGRDFEREKCSHRYMDSAVASFGKEVYKHIVAGADSLYRVDPYRYPDLFAEQATFPGGDSVMHRLLRENIKYPPAAKRDTIQGKVFVHIEIDTLGKITSATVLKGVRSDLDSVAVAGVRKLPAFQPPKMQGKRMPSSLTIPIAFKLE